MSEKYGLTEIGEYSPNELIAGAHAPVELGVTLAGGNAAMSAGSMLGRITASGKYKAYSASASDGSQEACAILAKDVPASSTDSTVCVFVHGVFNKGAIVGLTTAAGGNLQKNGIYLKEVY